MLEFRMFENQERFAVVGRQVLRDISGSPFAGRGEVMLMVCLVCLSLTFHVRMQVFFYIANVCGCEEI